MACSTYMRSKSVSLKDATLCYDTATNGYSASSFHTNCNGRGATITVALYNGALFGGYNDQSWTSAGSRRRSTVAFLFDSTNHHCHSIASISDLRYC